MAVVSPGAAANVECDWREDAGMTAEIDTWLEGVAGAWHDQAKEFLFLLLPVFSTQSRLYWPYLLATAVIAVALFAFRDRRDTFGVRGFFGYAIPKRLYLNWSAVLDYKFYAVNGIFEIFVKIGTMTFSGVLAADGLAALLTQLLGTGPALEVSWTARLVYSVGWFIGMDLGFFIGHYFTHRVPILWEFHKVHHAAEVLTPITNFRNHPVETAFMGLVMGVPTGLVTGVAVYRYGISPVGVTLLGAGLMTFFFSITGNLRHSHFWLSYGPAVSKYLCSPAMHQIHHSNAQMHWDTNIALYFSLWDRMTGTIYIPDEMEALDWGLGAGEHKEYNGLWALYALPFRKAWRLLAQPVDRDFVARVLWRPQDQWSRRRLAARARGWAARPRENPAPGERDAAVP